MPSYTLLDRLDIYIFILRERYKRIVAYLLFFARVLLCSVCFGAFRVVGRDGAGVFPPSTPPQSIKQKISFETGASTNVVIIRDGIGASTL